MTSNEDWTAYDFTLKSQGDGVYRTSHYQNAPNPFAEFGDPSSSITPKEHWTHNALAEPWVPKDLCELDRLSLVQHNFKPPSVSLTLHGTTTQSISAHSLSSTPILSPHPSQSLAPPSKIDPSLLYAEGSRPLCEEDKIDEEYGPDPEEMAAAQRYLTDRSRSPVETQEYESGFEELETTLTITNPESVQTDSASHPHSQTQSSDTLTDRHLTVPDDDPMDVDDTTNTAKDNTFPPSLAPQSDTLSTMEQGHHIGSRRERPPQGYISDVERRALEESSKGETLPNLGIPMTRRRRRELGL